MSKTAHSSRATLTREELAAQLERLLVGVRQGSIVLDNEHHPLILRPSDAISTSIDSKRKGSRETFELRISWTARDKHGVAHALTDHSALPETAATLADVDGEYAEPLHPGRYEHIAPTYITPPQRPDTEADSTRSTFRWSPHIRRMSAALKEALLSGDEVDHPGRETATSSDPSKNFCKNES